MFVLLSFSDKVTYETNGTDKIYYSYNMSSDLVSMNLNGTEYYYVRNAQGDIIGLIDGSGTQVVSYTYDSWGKLISIDGALKDSVGVKNPYRYRGYRYDAETGLYYLQSRYYNPEISRFINADRYIGFKELISCNMFSYCKNNCVNMFDSNGFMPTWAKWALGAVAVIAIAAIAVVALPAEVVAGAVTAASAVVIRVAQAARSVGPRVARVVGEVSETIGKNVSKSSDKVVFKSTTEAAKEIGKKTNGNVSQLKNGWKVEIPNGRKPIVVRIMNEGSGGRVNPYFRVGIDGKGSLTLDGLLSNDRGLTHIDMTDDYLEQITTMINKYLGK